MNDLFNAREAESGPVECLGQTFPSDQARRAHYLNRLAEKLKDPEFRAIEGFPQGTDEAILAMSDPPYYTACPNPWLGDFVEHYGKPYDPDEKYSREPLAIDVSVGKTDQLYKAHSYHTKVPHLAIVPSILHYTNPGDIVLDGFAGSGMTGVAAQWCASAPPVYREKLKSEWKQQGKTAPKWGARRVILNDLSPAATFIAANYNIPFDIEAFANAGKQLLDEVEQEIGWMYETLHTDGKTKGQIQYTVWSEIFTCPECAGEVNFLDEALDKDSKRVRDSFPCPHCGADMNKDKLERILETRLDPLTGKPWQRVRFKPSLISYAIGKTRYEKQPDEKDLAALARIESMPLPSELPTTRFPIEQMYHGSRIAPKGFTQVHHFFLPRAAHAIGVLWRKAQTFPDARGRAILLFMVEQSIWGFSVLNRYSPSHFSYEKQRARFERAPQMELFVSDERSAIDWLTDFLKERPSTYQDLSPEFMTQLGAGWRKHEQKPELSALLEDNFLRYDGSGNVPTQITNYLSKNFHDYRGLDKDDPRLIAKANERWYVPNPGNTQQLEQKREKALLKEFETYRAFSGRRIKETRLEVLRAGFKHTWSNKDFPTIITIAKKIPETTLLEDEKLLLWYDQALTRMESDA